MIGLTILMLAPLVFVGAAFAWAPSWNKAILFGARVDPVFRASDAARTLLRRHCVLVWLSTALAAALTWMALSHRILWLLLVAPFVQIAAATVSYARGWSACRPHSVPAPAVRTAPLRVVDEGLTGGFLVWLGPFLVIAAAAALLGRHWEDLPARVVVHWGVSGPDRWAEKSWRSVFGSLVIVGWVLLLLTGLGVAMVKGSRTPQNESSGSVPQLRVHTYLMLILSYVIAFMAANIALTPIYGRDGNMPVSPWIAPVLILAIVAVVVLKSAKLLGGPDGETDPTPDDCWKWGAIYFNPSDPVLIVPKRLGLGYTLNFANPISWALGGVILALPLLIFLIAV